MASHDGQRDPTTALLVLALFLVAAGGGAIPAVAAARPQRWPQGMPMPER